MGQGELFEIGCQCHQAAGDQHEQPDDRGGMSADDSGEASEYGAVVHH
ncbi:Uncharacterised protein [Mycobacteroides abscessus subsp. abscessus]|nr:Uncharacterised protein [Mycobacteroides abscessus subsp. abscessus]